MLIDFSDLLRKQKYYHANEICFFFFYPCPYSITPPSTSPCLYSLTLLSFYLITPSTYFMNLFVVYSDHYPSRSDIWFKFMTSSDKLEMVFSKFLLIAYANSPFAAFLTFMISSVSLIFCFRISIIDWYCYWMCKTSLLAYFCTVFA